MMEKNNNYTPSKSALYQRRYVKRVVPECRSIMCTQRREISTVPMSILYKLYDRCNKCRTNWDKGIRNCPCCGYALRRNSKTKRTI